MGVYLYWGYRVRTSGGRMANQGCSFQCLQVIRQLLPAGKGLPAYEHINRNFAKFFRWHIFTGPVLLCKFLLLKVDAVQVDRRRKQVATEKGDHLVRHTAMVIPEVQDQGIYIFQLAECAGIRIPGKLEGGKVPKIQISNIAS